jgi:hypothetical protein
VGSVMSFRCLALCRVDFLQRSSPTARRVGKSASVGEIANIVGLSRQTIYRIKDDPAASEGALATRGM